MTPSRIAEPPFRLFRPLDKELISLASGCPSSATITNPLTSVAPSGINMTGIRPRAQVGTRRPAIQCATTPASTPPTMPPRKPALSTLLAMNPMTKPGAMPGRSAIAKAM